MTAPAMTGDERRVIRKVALRLIPFLTLLYFVAFLDRVNVGFAALTMNRDLGLSDSAYGIGAGIFFIGYFFFEVPSNLLLKKFGARRWIARIMLTWGAISIAMAFVEGPASFWALRFALGVAEAGFFPGMVLYLTFWFPASVRAGMMGYFILANPLSSVFGAPASTAILNTHLWGLAGWQTMFIIEGIPAIILGVVVFFWLSDEPATARWLDPKERELLRLAIAREQRPDQGASLRDAFTSKRVWLFAIIYFGLNLGVYGFGFWAPQMIKSLGNLTNAQTGLVTMLPYACGAVAMLLWGRHSDRTGERVGHIVVASTLAAAGFLIGSNTDVLWIGIAAFSLGAMGIFGSLPVFWTLPTTLLTGTAAAAGIAMINSIGTLAGYAGPVLIGRLKEMTNDYSTGLMVLAAGMAMSAVLTLISGRASPSVQRG
jgi:ACS family tartrate transporter-like MFS transporter